MVDEAARAMARHHESKGELLPPALIVAALQRKRFMIATKIVEAQAPR